MATPSKGVTKRENRERERALRERVAVQLESAADELAARDEDLYDLAIALLRDEVKRWRQEA